MLGFIEVDSGQRRAGMRTIEGGKTLAGDAPYVSRRRPTMPALPHRVGSFMIIGNKNGKF